MRQPPLAAWCVGVVLAAACADVAVAAPLAAEEIATHCASAEGPAHCGRRVEEVQLARLPSLATRTGNVLKVSLYPTGSANFEDTEALNGGRTYNLWDFVNELNAVVLYTTDGDDAGFMLLMRTSGRKYELPSEPRISPDRQRLVTADFCATGCTNELAVWRVTRDSLRKESTWRPAEAWSDAVASWKDPETLVVEYTATGQAGGRTMERRLGAPGWLRVDTP